MRHRVLVLVGWLGVAVVLAIAFPQLESVVERQSVQLLPAGAPSSSAVEAMATAFDEDGSRTPVVVAMENSRGISARDEIRHAELVARLRADTDHVRRVDDLLADPVTRPQAISADRKAWFVPVGVTGTLGDPQAAASIDAVREAADEVFAGSGTRVRVTGPAATFHDQIATAEHELLVISVVTVVAIGLILVLIYRSLATSAVPLVVIGVVLVVARGVLSALGELGIPVSQFTIAFTTAVVLGAGTDYSVFLISRYHEHRRRGTDPDAAIVAACSGVGPVIVASAATVALALASMVLAKLAVFQGVGPACAIAIAVGLLVTLTFLPALMSVAARRGLLEPRGEHSRRYWRRLSVAVVRRPGRMIALGLAVLVPLALVAATISITYDDRRGQPSTTASNEGYRLLDDHFPKDLVISDFLLIRSPSDLRTAQGLAHLDAVASRVAQLPGVTRVAGVTRPDGSRIAQARLSWQNSEIGRRVGGETQRAQQRSGDLRALADGADQLAGGLTQLEAMLRPALAPLSGLLAQAGKARGELEAAQPVLSDLTALAPLADQALAQRRDLGPLVERADAAVGAIEPLAGLLTSAPVCAALPQCARFAEQIDGLVHLRSSGFFTQIGDLGRRTGPVPSITDTLTRVTAAATSMRTALAQVGDPADVSGQITQLTTGVSTLATGSRALAAGVRTLVDSNLDQLTGMAQLAAQLRESGAAADRSDASSGFYLPTAAFDNRRFVDVAARFLSADGRTARLAVTSTADPFSGAAIDLDKRVVATARAALPNTPLQGSDLAMVGFPAVNADLQSLLSRDFRALAIATIVIVLGILMMLIRAVVAPLYLIGTVVLNYLAALGLGVLVFQHVLGEQIAWPVPLLAFIILIAVGADYNLLLVARLREESGTTSRAGTMRTVVSTGSVITSAGLIFAASMFGLLVGSVTVMVQAGFVIGSGILIDTFVVRTLLVPAIAGRLGAWNWWPSRST